MSMKINDETDLICPKCLEIVSSEQFDAFTLSMCKTRELRRAYKSIVHMWNRPGKKRDFHFCCPYCQAWSRVNEIKVYSADTLARLKVEKASMDNEIKEGVYEEKKKAQAPKFDRNNNGKVVFAHDIEFDIDEDLEN